MTAQEITAKIADLEAQLAHPVQHQTEVYTRIVGYYRSLANWNAGKREEYDHRVTFAEDDARIDEALKKAEARFPELKSTTATAAAGEKAASYIVFLKKHCPNCPAMKAKLPEISVAGTVYDTDSDAGMEAALQWDIYATPTLILQNAAGQELARISSALDWKQISSLI